MICCINTYRKFDPHPLHPGQYKTSLFLINVIYNKVIQFSIINVPVIYLIYDSFNKNPNPIHGTKPMKLITAA